MMVVAKTHAHTASQPGVDSAVAIIWESQPGVDSVAVITWERPAHLAGLTCFRKTGQPGKTGWLGVGSLHVIAKCFM